VLTHWRDFPHFQHESWEIGEKEGATSAQQISIVSFLNSSFILPLDLSSVHVKNIKTWFMEMSESDASIEKHTTADDYNCFTHVIYSKGNKYTSKSSFSWQKRS